jgi:hypothetical protein
MIKIIQYQEHSFLSSPPGIRTIIVQRYGQITRRVHLITIFYILSNEHHFIAHLIVIYFMISMILLNHTT